MLYCVVFWVCFQERDFLYVLLLCWFFRVEIVFECEYSFVEISDVQCFVVVLKVSVLMLIYNYGDYLFEVIEGVVVQNCNFDFELIIGEDVLVDDIFFIVFVYQFCFLKIIRVIYLLFNVGIKENGKRICLLVCGEYVSFCEGDDFWCVFDKFVC